jgi:hypothetical protein
MKRNNTPPRALAKNDVTTALANREETKSLQRSHNLRAGEYGKLRQRQRRELW